MTWYCLKCGRKNLIESFTCSKCQLDKESACSYPVYKRLNMCEECGHRHREGQYCHVYTEAGDINFVDDVISESEEEEEESDDSEDYVPTSKKASTPKPKQPKLKVKPMKVRPLSTPAFVRSIGFVRCNCKEGVPMECLRYEPVPRIVMAGDIIHVQTYTEIMDPSERTRYISSVASQRTETAMIKRKRDEDEQLAHCIPLILSYLHFGQCSEVPKVCRTWNYGTSLYKQYIDVRNFVPWKVKCQLWICKDFAFNSNSLLNSYFVLMLAK